VIKLHSGGTIALITLGHKAGGQPHSHVNPSGSGNETK